MIPLSHLFESQAWQRQKHLNKLPPEVQAIENVKTPHELEKH